MSNFQHGHHLLKADDSDLHRNFEQAVIHHQEGRLAQARDLYLQTLQTDPAHFDALHLLGVIAYQSGDAPLAVDLIQRALTFNALHPTAHLNLGNAQRSLQQWALALQSYDRAIELNPQAANAHFNKGLVLLTLNEHHKALSSLQEAVRLQPDSASFAHQCGLAHQHLAQYAEAIQCFDAALRMEPVFADALNDKGYCLQQLRNNALSLKCYQHAVSVNPDHAAAWQNQGTLLLAAKDWAPALHCLEKAYALNPDSPYLLGVLLHTQMQVADWRDLDIRMRTMAAQVQRQQAVIPPFVSVTVSSDMALQSQAAQIWVQDKFAAYRHIEPVQPYKNHPRIRIGYFSADFHEHATAYLMAELFELHDKNQFEIFAYSFGPSQNDVMRCRLTQAFEHFHDVAHWTDAQIVALARSHEIDIAIDLKGYTTDSRADLFAMRVAPVQVNYLGYPGTMGAPFIDYLIADTVVVPQDQLQHYSEKIAYLPGCYQPNDRHRVIADKTMSRHEAGLPEQGFVFCSFNNTYKITPATLDSWARILNQVPGSVIWLLADNALGVQNLKDEAASRGIDSERLIFAPRVPLDIHLARHQLADLFLDTLPCNAHTTASDALWAGLPVLTCMGDAFASRVAASLLSAMGVPELICGSAEELEAMAIGLAKNPLLLSDLKNKLHQQRTACPLFDTPKYVQHLESAYSHMYSQSQAGVSPAHFGVQAPVLDAEVFYNQARAHHDQGDFELALQAYAQALKLEPTHFNSLHMAGILMAQQSEFESAEILLAQAVKAKPDDADAHSNWGMVLNELQKFEQAKLVLQRAVQLNPQAPIAFSNLGLAYGELEDWELAARHHAQAIALAPENAASHYNQGHTLIQAREYETALVSLENALDLNPRLVQAWTDKGIAYEALKRPHQALEAFETACQLQPDYGRAHFCLGRYWTEQHQFENALAALRRAIDCNPMDPQTYCSQGAVFREQKNYKEALKSLDQALTLDPDLIDAHTNKALVLQLMGKMQESQHHYNRAIAKRAEDALLFNNRAVVLYALERHQESLNDLHKALKLRPNYVEALVNLGNVLVEIKQIDKALECYSRALELDPEYEFLEGIRLHAQMQMCDWTDYENRREQIIRKINEGKKVAPPFMLIAITDDIDVQRKAAQLYLPPAVPPSKEFPELHKYSNHSKIILGYFSADFHDHATMYLMAEFFELHDKSKFEIHAFSFGPDKNDDMRKRAIKAFDQFHDVRNHTDEEIVHLARSLEIDIAFDLKGCTKGSRPRIFALRAAPIQINYLGYPGTMGVSYFDYIISDRYVIPDALKEKYSENIIYIDGCYQPHDSLRKVYKKDISRSEYGLPENGFIYCCFNNNYKITPEVLDSWSKILKARPDSYIWLFQDNIFAKKNLQSEFIKRDVDIKRIIFAEYIESTKHIARQALSDVFIDTYPCNAHTTARDAIFMNLSLISYSGKSFASRVANSIAMNFTDQNTIAKTIDEYELKAITFDEKCKKYVNSKISTQDYLNLFELKIIECQQCIN